MFRYKKPSFVALVLATMAACEAHESAPERPAAPALTDVAGGSRLRPVFLEPRPPGDGEAASGEARPAGEAIFLEWHDTHLGLPCALERATTPSGGAVRCVPRPTAPAPSRFLNAGCTTPVAHERGEPGAIVATRAAGVCGAPAVKVYRRGAMMTAASLYVADGDGGCAPAREGPTEVQPLEELTATLATFAPKRGPAADGLAPVALESADGARAFGAFWDVAREAACLFPRNGGAPILTDDGKWRCLPPRGRGVGDDAVEREPACGGAAVIWRAANSCPQSPLQRWRYSHAPCLAIVGVEEARQRLSCAAEARPAFAALAEPWALESLSLTALPAAQLGRPEGRGRLKARFIESAAGRRRLGAWDAKLEAPCSPARVGEEALACVPDGPNARPSPLVAFADAACTKRVIAASRCGGPRFLVTRAASSTPAPAEGPAEEDDESAASLAAAPVVAVHRLAAHDGRVYELRGARCTGLDRETADLPATDGWFVVDAAIALRDLVSLDRVVR